MRNSAAYFPGEDGENEYIRAAYTVQLRKSALCYAGFMTLCALQITFSFTIVFDTSPILHSCMCARQLPPQLHKSIKKELEEWSLGKFSRNHFWQRGTNAEETTNTKPAMKYSGEDILQNGVLDVESRLGEGGMGQVYLARNKEDGTTVAVKVGKEVGMPSFA